MREKLSKKLAKTALIIKNIPNKKNHIDFIAALLTIPVLVSVIILNYSNLQKTNTKTNLPSPTPAQVEKQIIITAPPNNPQVAAPNTQPTASPSATCIKQVGPVSIVYPTENQTVSDNPLCINISYSNSNYCSVVWSYRINGGTWSDYNSNSPCIYNLPNGNIKFDLRVQSTVAQDQQQTFTRNFVYNGQGTIATPSPTPTASSSANLQ